MPSFDGHLPQYLSIDVHLCQCLYYLTYLTFTRFIRGSISSSSSFAERKLLELVPILTGETNLASWSTILKCAPDTRDPHFFEMLTGKQPQSVNAKSASAVNVPAPVPATNPATTNVVIGNHFLRYNKNSLASILKQSLKLELYILTNAKTAATVKPFGHLPKQTSCICRLSSFLCSDSIVHVIVPSAIWPAGWLAAQAQLT